MRFWILWLAACCIGARAGHAQLAVEIVLEQQQFLKDESMPIKVRITNRSGQTLHLGKQSDWLTFSVAGHDGLSAPKLREVPLPGEFDLESASVATRRVDLMPHFDFREAGRYTIGATLKVPQWEQEINCRPAQVEVVRGTKLWEQEFGVPVKEGSPEARKYILQQAQFLKQLTLYVRVSDADENRTFRVFAAGPMVSFNRPQAQVDKESKLHLLFQTGPRSFTYNVVSPAGDLLLRQVYDHTGGSSVRLKSEGDGFIFVSGGVRRVTPEHTASLSNTNDVQTPTH
jgi:hypothetical protein